MIQLFSLLAFYFLFTLGLWAEVPKNNTVAITAKLVSATQTSVIAKGDVVVQYDATILKSDQVIYDKEKQTLILDGHVELIGYTGSKEHGNHMEIDTQTKNVKFDKLFLVSENDVWLYSENVFKKDGNYTLGQTLLSSCDNKDPIWKMFFEHSQYDAQSKYMKIYDAKVYLWDTPIFYTPYLSFSTNKERTSGLLFPYMRYTDLEGFLYEQPIYWAVSSSIDVEFNPQIRTDRSIGMYSTLRFVDSPNSKGEIRLGYFKDTQDYVEKNNLPNNSHYGFEINYESSKVLSHYLPSDYVDGLYVNVTLLNDIDYLNLQKNYLNHFGLTPLQESRINYFTYNNDYYAGLNEKYFIDTREDVNDEETLQILPSIQLHKFLNHILFENFTYSADLKFNNFERKVGSTMKQVEFRFPLELTCILFDDFLNISAGEEFYYSKFFFGNGQYDYSNYEYYSNIHKINFFTDLTKEYKNFIHILQPSFKYVKPGNQYQTPVNFSLLEPAQQELFVVGLPEETYTFSLSQYFYDKDMTLRFYQRLSQIYFIDRKYQLADLTNEMQYNMNAWNFYNNTIYSHEFGKVGESSSYINYASESYRVRIGHTYKDILPDDINSPIGANDVNLGFGYTMNDNIDFNVYFTYNLEDKSSRQWRLEGSYHKNCWNVTASIREDIIPRPTGFTKKNTFYIKLDFIPFGSIGAGD